MAEIRELEVFLIICLSLMVVRTTERMRLEWVAKVLFEALLEVIYGDQ